MTRARVGLLCVCVLVASGSAAAQGKPQGWDISAEALNVLTRGNDVHVGDIFTESQTNGGTLVNSTLNYGVTYNPIVTNMQDKISALVAASYRGSRWGFGGRGWWVTTNGATQGSARSPAPTPSTTAVTGVRMWDHSLIPVENDFEPSGNSPVTYHASNAIENLRVDGFAEHVWISNPGVNVAMRFGLSYAKLENTRSEGHEESAAFTDVTGGTSVAFTNLITLQGDSTSTMKLYGPSFGLAGDATHARLRIDWLINPAVLLGTAETSGSWVDTDNITQVTSTTAGPVLTTDRLRGVLPYELDERALVPVLDLQLRASVRVAGPLRLGAGLFSSSWFHVPMAPALSVPGNWTDVEGTGWRAQPRDLTFFAYSVFAGVSF